MADYENTSQAAWNADAIELSVVFAVKMEVSSLLDSWDLDKCYWKTRTLRRELDAILTRRKKKLVDEFEKENNRETILEKVEIDSLIDTLNTEREIYLVNKDNNEAKNKFYNLLEDLYMHLCFIMKKHGLYFRESNDMGFAAGRR